MALGMSNSPDLLATWREKGTDETTAIALAGDNLAENLKSLNGLGIDLWRNEKDYAAALVVFQRIIVFAEDRNLDPEAKGVVKAAAFNASANLWRGWSDAPEISDEQADLGFKYAALNMGLAYELKKGDLAISRAEWLQAAHQMQKGQYSVAKSGFERAAGLAERDREMSEVRMNLAYSLLAQQLADGAVDEAALRSVFEPEDDAFFIDQVLDAARAFA